MNTKRSLLKARLIIFMCWEFVQLIYYRIYQIALTLVFGRKFEKRSSLIENVYFKMTLLTILQILLSHFVALFLGYFEGSN